MQFIGQGALLTRAQKYCESHALHADDVIFSINNPRILTDEELEGKRVYNIHAGLTQRYRGIGEVCVFAALCEGAEEYGVTLHRVLPHDRVDCGPIIAQQQVQLHSKDTFESLMTKVLNACQRIFDDNARLVVQNRYVSQDPNLIGNLYRYLDISRLIESATADNLQRATTLGKYAGYLPKLCDALNEYA